MVGEAVKTTELPEQVGLEPEVMAMLTLAVSWVVIVRLIAFEVAVELVTQPSVEVITTVMLPAVVPASVYVELFVPTLAPSFFHW